MIWKKLILKNFLSFEHVELNLDDRGLVLIEGKNNTSEKFKSNGSGKTSLLEGIVYALYDVTSKGIKADEVVNRIAGKNTEVILEGVRGEDIYRIERYRKHKTHKNKVKLFINDKDMSEKSTAATNKAIESIIGVDYNTFINSIMFSQGTGAGRFAIATDKEKKEILENIINLAVYAEAQEIAKERIRGVESDTRVAEHRIERVQWQLAQLDVLDRQDADNYEKTKQLIEQEEQNLKKLIAELEEYKEKHQPLIGKTENRIDELLEKKQGITVQNMDSYTARVNELYKAIQQKKSQIDQLNYKKSEIVKQYKKVEQDTNCPICGNLLDQEHRQNEMLSLKEQLKSVLLSLQPLQKEYEGLLTDYEAEQAEYNRVKQEYDEVYNEYNQINNDIMKSREFIREIQYQIQSRENKLDNTRSSLERLKSVPKPPSREEERETLKTKLKAEREGLLALERKKKQLEDVVKIYSNSGVKSHVLDLVTPFLNERANHYVSKLSGSDTEIKFTTQKKNKDGSYSDKFDLQIVNRAGGETYKSNSEGEKKRIDLAISLAIQDLVLKNSDSSSNFIIYDEVFDALDSVGAENVITLLKERLNTVNSIFVITHSEHLKPLFEKVITVVKDKDSISKLEEGAETT